LASQSSETGQPGQLSISQIYGKEATIPRSTATGLTATEHGENVGSNVNTQEQHHSGRDAALVGGAGAAGLGGYEAKKHHDAKTSEQLGQASNTHSQTSEYQPQTYDSRSVNPQDQHHYGRDAALVGGTGAAGLGGYEAKKHHDTKNQEQPGQTSTTHSQTSEYQPHTHDSRSINPQDQHHYGRDAGIAGGTGAAGLGAYEAKKHHDAKNHEQFGQASTTHSQPSEYQPQTYDSRSVNPQDQHHYGRDAALVGGAGAAGLGGYEAKKHHDAKNQEQHGQTSTTHSQTSEYQPHTHDSRSINPQDQHHYGRDAGIAGGTGAVGLGAYEAKKHHDANDRTPAQPTSQSAPLGASTQPRQDTHYGTDGAIGAGSAFAASSALGHEHDSAQRSGTSSVDRSNGDGASNASIKSGVLGRAPTGSSVGQNLSHEEDTPLPYIPATGGRFMEDGISTQSQRCVFVSFAQTVVLTAFV
jgi:hypothetical protein